MLFPDEYEEDYAARCTNPDGHEFVVSEEDGRCYCQWCLADGDA